MNEELRALVPQMADYLAETHVYVPYLMHSAQPGIRRTAFTTDEHGFRTTLRDGQPVSLDAFRRLSTESRPSALIGNSTAFGVGATSDAATIASQLNAIGPRVFFNFAGRAFNHVQELIAFLLFGPARVDAAVVMSGINLLDMSYRFASDAHVDLPPFHLERLFLSRVDREPDDRIGAWLRRAWRRLRGRPLGDGFLAGDATAALRLGLADAGELIRQPGNAERALAHFAHVAGVWRSLAPSRIGRLLVALQPVPDWFGRSLSPHEQRLLALSEAHRPPAWHVVREHVRQQAAGFRDGMLAACRHAGVEVVDLNTSPVLLETPWVFIDRYHLSDAAQRSVASILAARLDEPQRASIT